MTIILGPLDHRLSEEGDDRWIEYFFGGFATATCLWCGAEFDSYPVVHWLATVDIFLHPTCAEDMGKTLLYEARDATKPRNANRIGRPA